MSVQIFEKIVIFAPIFETILRFCLLFNAFLFMEWTSDMPQFITDHLNDDVSRLLLSARRYPSLDVPFAVEQIEARRRLRTKLPEWYALPDLIMGGRIPAEQCSSEQTARFKRSIMLADAHSLCDMTGGMGVDFWYMSQGLDYAVYTERQPALCEAARHNFGVLRGVATSACSEIVVREGLSTELPIPDVDVIYLDPARRSIDGSRIYEISDCDPDVVSWQHDLLAHCRQLITKVSPMADISRTLSRLVGVTHLYVVSVRNECKELLVVQQHDASTDASLQQQIHCVDFLSDHTTEFQFSKQKIGALDSQALAVQIGQYLYEPDVSIMKAQGFKALAECFGVRMLDTDCHYFTSDDLIPDFPGRIFRIDQEIEFSSRVIRQLRRTIPQANIAVRHFPLAADELRRRTGIRDGGEVYLFGATLQNVGPLLLLCSKYKQSIM